MRADLFCNSSATVLDVMRILNENATGTAFVIDDQQKLKGVVTDGDIRRWLIKGVDLNEQIRAHVSESFVYAKQSQSMNEILAMTNEKIRFVPIVNEEMRVVDFVQYDSRFRLPVATPDLKGNELSYLVEAFLSTWISSTGAYINKFEEQFSHYCDQQYGVATSNGTTALHLALTTLGIKEGDEVIVPDLTFAATINVVLYCKATPVIVDVELDSWCIDPEEIKKAITPKTKAIIPVHLYGQPCDMDPIMAIAEEHNLYVVEDCAEAHGAKYKGKVIGSFGHVNCYSFYGNKIITTGEGGMCVTNDKELDRKMRVYRDHGMSKEKRYWHEVVGFNYRMTNLQAAIGVAQLERIEEIHKFRSDIEQSYKANLNDLEELEFQRDDLEGREKITWLVCALITGDKRDEYMEALNQRGLDCRPFFYPLSTMPIYKEYIASNTVSINVSTHGINFPTSKEVDQKTIDLVKEVFKK
ncbi:MAG: aminotransferase class I/II-fold pyridoxal phosphate-dependent enzyme [Flavobacteriales bacterium]|nr:aminotransferase class I/II-fold pyridoxal phosphate-dependent enzyme [Flavobacteriales bacterium]